MSTASLSGRDEFADLRRRLLVTVSQLRVVSDVFGDLSGLPEEYVAAGLVTHEVTEDLGEIWEDLDAWHVSRTHELKHRGERL
jgi:hypothetical protein